LALGLQECPAMSCEPPVHHAILEVDHLGRNSWSLPLNLSARDSK